MQELNWAADARLDPGPPKSARETPLRNAGGRGSDREQRGLNTDYLSFILKPCYLSELLGFLFPTWNPLKPEAYLTQEVCN